MFDKYNKYKEIKMPEDIKNNILVSMRGPAVYKRGVKRVYIIAAVCAVVLMMAGAGIMTDLIKVNLFNFGGDINSGRILMQSTYQKSPELEAFESEYWHNGFAVYYKTQELQEDTLNIGQWLDIEASAAFREIRDYDELKNYIDNLGGRDIFKLPEYLPEGFVFETARVSFQVTDKIDYEESEPVYSQEKEGYLYEKYILPEILESISEIAVSYSRDSDIINYSIYSMTPDIDSINFAAAVNDISVEMIGMPQFDRSAVSKNGDNNNFHAVKLIEQRFNIMSIFVASREYREKMYRESDDDWKRSSYKENLFAHEKGSIVYSIADRSNLSVDEILKIAESIG